jgi:hypothetical protein
MGKRAYRGVDHCKDRIPYVLPFLSSSLLNAFGVRGYALFDHSFRVASPQGSPVSSHRRRHRQLYNQWPIDGPVIGLLVLGHGHRLALERRNIYSGFARCAQLFLLFLFRISIEGRFSAASCSWSITAPSPRLPTG